jgi:hypothetical protein
MLTRCAAAVDTMGKRILRIDAARGRLIHARLSNRLDADRLARQTTRRENPASGCSLVVEPSHG